MQRRSLQSLIKAMFALLGLTFLYVLFSSISGTNQVGDSSALFDDVAIGQTALRRNGQRRVWVSRFSGQQLTELTTLESVLVDPAAGCEITLGVCVLDASASRSGIDIVFSDSVPAQLASGLPWFGGFVDPTTGELFDRLGRAYSSTHRGRSELVQAAD
ncbi:hypothetical protein NBRC116583_07740 [Arenicella sp. 4NH20-0111]|uniref:hypothetical protein n=1 Tax=Arenicella sp. 4NH20-0111 TaxID=3127648 RepID=UPI00310AD289